MARFGEPISITQTVAPPVGPVSAETPLTSETYVPRTMPAVLGPWSMTMTFVICIYLSTGSITALAAGPAAFTYLLVCSLTFFIPSLIATAQLGVIFPYEGAPYNWTHKVLGGYWSFFSGFCAWFPSVLISTSFAVLLVTYAQKMNPAWLPDPWQQGVAISLILLGSAFICIQRFATVNNLVNITVGLLLAINAVIGLAGIVWLVTGHPSATNFTGHWSEWTINPGNFVLFGLIVFAFIGTDSPLIMGGEMKGKRVVERHLFWGGAIIIALYSISTFSLLVVQGQAAPYDPFMLVTTVEKVFGKLAGNVTAICLMASFVIEGMVYNYVFARLLMVAGIDNRLPAGMARLNKNRVPAAAIMLQAILGVIITLIGYNLVPMVSFLGSPVDLSIKVYSVSQAAALLVWAISTLFIFLDVVLCYRRYRELFLQKRIMPLAVIWLSVTVGTLSCVLGIIDVLWYSWIPNLINNSQWWYIVGCLAVAFLIFAAIASMFASSEAAWQHDTKTETP
jgi:amino acid transporter